MRKVFHIIYNKFSTITAVLLLLTLALTLCSLDSSTKIPDYDKLYHLIIFSLLSFPVSIRKPPFFISICVSFFFLGGLIELIQPYFNRDSEFTDFLFNTLGISIGIISGLFVRKYIFQK